MKIAICDDEPAVRSFVRAAIEEIMLTDNIEVDYETFLSYDSLIDRIDEFDLFILDYKMPKINGLDFAKKLYSQYNTKKGIIFITAYPEIVYDAIEVRTYRFLVKPLEKNKLIEAISTYIHDSAASRILTVKTDNEITLINIDDIYYLEAARKYTYIYLANSCFTAHTSISSLEKKLANCDFFRLHRSYLVNMNKILKFDSRICQLKNGEKIFISQKRYNEVCHRYLKTGSREGLF